MPARDYPAWCPECGRKIATFTHGGRPIFEHHTPRPNMRVAYGEAEAYPEPCPGSGWLVEDEDRVA